MIYFDTNVLIRLIVGDVPAQAARAEAVIQQAGKGEIVIIDTVLEEACTVLEFNRAYLLPRAIVHQAMTMLLLERPVFYISNLAEAALVHYGAQPKLDFTDCLLLALAKNGRDTEVVTFDKELLKCLGTVQK